MSTFIPSRTKYRKIRKVRARGTATSGAEVSFGTIGLKALGNARLTSRHLETLVRSVTKKVKKEGGIVVTRLFPHLSVTKKAAETRMGGGKGSPDRFVAPTQLGKIILEIGNVSDQLAIDAINSATVKLPLKTSIVKRRFSAIIED